MKKSMNIIIGTLMVLFTISFWSGPVMIALKLCGDLKRLTWPGVFIIWIVATVATAVVTVLVILGPDDTENDDNIAS